MISKLIQIVLVMLWVLPVQAAEDFEFGPRPPLAVFDPSGLLDPALAKSISDPLTTIYQNEGVDVIVVVLTEIGQAPPEHVARQFATAWCKSPIHCLVLHVPGREGSPWIVPAGKMVDLINPDAVKTAVSHAHRRVSAEADDAGKIKASATEAADMLRIWMGSAITRTTDIQAEIARMKIELEAQSRGWKLGAMVAAAAFIPLVTLMVLVIVLLGRRAPRHFTSNQWQRRLGAPHSGGNQAAVNLASRIP